MQNPGNFSQNIEAFSIPKPPMPPPQLQGSASYTNEVGGVTFGETLMSMMGRANDLMGEPERMTIDISTNPNSKYDIHDVMIAMGKSEVAFKLITAVSQKGINTFDKLTNMQI